ncbi:hypothetical protein PFDG_05112, partial [Plasmodium falciparum Dd2]
EVDHEKRRDLCFELKDICSTLELEIKEKNLIIDDFADKLNQSEKKKKDYQVILELSKFNIQNFNDNVKHFTSKGTEVVEKLSNKDDEIPRLHAYKEKIKQEKENLFYEHVHTLEQLNEPRCQ